MQSDGSDILTVFGTGFTENGNVLFTTPAAEYYLPSGFETMISGNYDLMPTVPIPPTPSPTPTRSPTIEQPYLSDAVPGCTFRTIWPSSTDVVLYPRPTVFKDTTVVVPVPANQAPGYNIRIGVHSPVDRSILFTASVLVPFSTPIIQVVDPPVLPLSGGILNLHGRSFGFGGRVYIQQRLFYTSSSVSGDPAYAGIYTVPWEVDVMANIQGDYLGRTGLSLKYHHSVLESPAIADAAVAAGVVTVPVASSEVGSGLSVYQECFLLDWNQSYIRCLAPPGIDNLTTIVVDVGWGQGSVVGLLYQPSLPCLYNTTLNGTFFPSTVPVFKSQFVTGLWSGILVGFGCLLAFMFFGVRLANIDFGDLFTMALEAVTLKPRMKKRSMVTSSGGGQERRASAGGSSLRRSSQASRPLSASRRLSSAVLEPSRATLDSVALRSFERQSFQPQSVGLSSYLEDSVAQKEVVALSPPKLSKPKKVKPKRASDASFREMAESVEREASTMLASREAKELLAYRRANGMDDNGNVLPVPPKWWHCCCCRKARRPRSVLRITEPAPMVEQGPSALSVMDEDLDMMMDLDGHYSSMGGSVQRMAMPVMETTSIPSAVSLGNPASTASPRIAHSMDSVLSDPALAASPAVRGKAHPLSPLPMMDSSGVNEDGLSPPPPPPDVMKRGVFGAGQAVTSAKSPTLRVWQRGSESDGSDGEC